MKKNFVEELRWRGMLQDIMPGTEEQLMKEVTTAYVGIDPTQYGPSTTPPEEVGMYKAIIKFNDSNGEFEAEYDYIKELYAERIRKNDFLENREGLS